MCEFVTNFGALVKRMIKFTDHDRRIVFPRKTLLKSFLEKLFKREGKKVNLVRYIFCSDEYLLQINRQFLHHDYYTDIITFDLGNTEEVEAEVYISVDRINENAVHFETTRQEELLRVIFHGALHLSGYRDKTKSEITLMREKESEYLRLFEKANPRK